MTQEDFDLIKFLEDAYKLYNERNQRHIDDWGMGMHPNWTVDQDRGEIYWHLDNGFTAFAPVQVIGSYNPADSTFLWGWDHPSVLEHLRSDAALCKEWGETHGQEFYVNRKINCDDATPLEFIAVALKLADANGAYIASTGSDGPTMYMTFGEIQLWPTSKVMEMLNG